MNKNLTSGVSWLSSPWPFFVAAFGWSWLFWILAALPRVGTDRTAGERSPVRASRGLA